MKFIAILAALTLAGPALAQMPNPNLTPIPDPPPPPVQRFDPPPQYRTATPQDAQRQQTIIQQFNK
jgi:hypothetical protein